MSYYFVAAILVLASLALQFYYLHHFDLSDETFGRLFWIDILSQACALVAIGLILGTLVAFIPYNKNGYWDKFTYTVPVAISFVTLFVTVVYTWSTSAGRKQGIISTQGKMYRRVKTPEGLDCSAIRNGTFETGAALIERHDSVQVETNKETKQRSECKVEWLDDCEYRLTPLDSGKRILKVKIISVSPTDYKCYVAQGDYAIPFKLDIVKLGN